MKDTKDLKVKAGVEQRQHNRPVRKVAGGRGAGFYAADKDGNISVVSQSLARLLKYSSKEEVVGLNIADKLYETKEDRGAFLKKLSQEGTVEGYAVNMVRKDGSRIVLSAHSTLLCDEAGEPVGVEGVLEEIVPEGAIIKAKDRPIPDLVPINENAANTFDGLIKDPLTGLLNYQYFMTCLNTELKRVERIFHPTCLMMIDLDNFSVFNQKNGRAEGDELLKTVASLLRDNLRPTDIHCRQAQDQFLILLTETTREEALVLAKKAKDVIQQALADKKVTSSIGMSRFIIGMTVQELFLQANLGVYMAKAAGKNEACFYG
ncbi:MAG: sensor domain-containing diguanylate cyclase [Candidatus Omnitrophica bacterium]|nr:sensor domain-containing diguanylate cyclase [Candidatus Omnitrophota bacterium]